MKYDNTGYNKAVEYYKKNLKAHKGDSVLLVSDTTDSRAFFSYAPLTQAIHELGKQVDIFVITKRSPMLDALERVWLLKEELDNGGSSKAAKALDDFITEVDKKAKGKFRKLFAKPQLMLQAKGDHFSGTLKLDYKDGWFKPHRHKMLVETCDIVARQVINLKKSERFSVGFVTMPPKKELKKPLEDYLDSYAICWAFRQAAANICKEVSMGASTSKPSMLEPMNRLSDLRVTLLGCELTKFSKEPVFSRFAKLSEYIGTDKLKVSDASFFISDKGYPGKHMFGELYGYPAPGNKTRWQSPGGFVHKLDYSPQTKDDPRMPMSRVSFTETLPLDVFIKTSHIDWMEMKKKDDKLKRIANRCDRFIVKSNIKEQYTTNFEVGMIKPDGSHRWPRGSDVDTRSKVNETYKKRTGRVAGNMANIPGGEMFITPEYVEGTVVGDVVISIDQSYVLDEKKPFVISAKKTGYKVIDAPKDILSKFEKKKKDAWKNILAQEKHGSVPKEITDLKKRNFAMIGEFAINTNPEAELCDYLIVNEKIANMIHVAMGSGFEPDRATEYHTDVVINAKRQKLDIYGIETGTGKKIWVLKKGKFAF